ncbi:MAG: putative drug exporter of the superfamily [Mycobacterium sp.]|jgi:RND superfamily putative drug exporter|nr:putative drug exporter of the superfamily [Mycobacterium sp.]
MGVELCWVILPLAVILLLAVGSDYNLLLVSRFKEEIHSGINTGTVRSFMTPPIAALLGRWFWWRVRVRQRPIPQKFGDENTRQLSLF